MKRFFKPLILIAVPVFLLSTVQADIATQKPIVMGVEYHVKSTEAPLTQWNMVVQKIESTLHQPVRLVEYHGYQKLLHALEKGKVALAYMKKNTGDQAISNDHIHSLATALTRNERTGKISKFYNSYLFVTKDSPVKTIADLHNKTLAYYSKRSMSNYLSVQQLLTQHHTTVKWDKFHSEQAAFNAVLTHRADAMGAWDGLLYANAERNQFRVIDRIRGLINPSLYVNTTEITPNMQRQLRIAMTHVKGPYNIVGFN